jgi:hypothetical protein
MQNFNLFENDARSLPFDRARNERIFQISVIFHPISALCESFLGKRDLIKILCGDHKRTLGNASQQARGQPNALLVILREENDH